MQLLPNRESGVSMVTSLMVLIWKEGVSMVLIWKEGVRFGKRV